MISSTTCVRAGSMMFPSMSNVSSSSMSSSGSATALMTLSMALLMYVLSLTMLMFSPRSLLDDRLSPNDRSSSSFEKESPPADKMDSEKCAKR